MAGVTFGLKVLGIEQLKKHLKPETIKDPVTAGIKKIILFLDRETKRATPVDTGRLRASITPLVQPTFGKIGTNVKYASFVEYGTSKMAARHLEGGKRVYGLGMFGYAFQLLQDRISDFLEGIGKAISVKWER